MAVTNIESLHNLDAEAAVISACFLQSERFDEVADMLPADAFYSDANKWIWRSLIHLIENGKKVDVVNAAEWLDANKRLNQIGGTPYLAGLIDATPAIAHVRDHAKIVYDKWRIRLALAKSQELASVFRSGAVQGESDLQAALEQAESFFGSLAQDTVESHMRLLRDHIAAAHDQMHEQNAAKTSLVGVDIGITKLNDKLAGYISQKLYVVAARPGMGKTAFMLNNARHIAGNQDGVAIFSLEMPGEELALRMISTESKVDFDRLRKVMSLTSDEWNKSTAAESTLAKLPIWVDESPSVNLSQIRARVRKLKSDIKTNSPVPCNGLKVVMVDYLQFMGGYGGRSREQEIAAISRGLKELSKTEDVAVIVLSQLNRGVESRDDKRPMLQDLRESGAIEQDADVVMFLYRPEYYLKKKDAALEGWADVIIAKQRGGPTGSVRVAFVKETVRFGNLEESDYDVYDPNEFDDVADN
jgi:replicative DNA helicase